MRYFFHYRNENGLLIEDRFGSEHSSLEAVEEEARDQARDTFEEAIQAGGDPQAARCIEVVNERGIEVLYLPFWASYVIADPLLARTSAVELGADFGNFQKH